MTAPTHTLFLDIDGVLHDADSSPQHLMLFAPLLGDLLAAAPGRVDVVVHSNWRHDYSLSDMKRFIPELAHHLVGVTPTDIAARYDSIARYVAEHDVRRYRVLDDARVEFPVGWRRLIACDRALGISDPAALAKLKFWLGIK